LDENKYFYKKPNPLQAMKTTFLQPFMNIFGDHKVTHFYHFKNLTQEEISNLKSTKPLILESKTTFRKFNNNSFGLISSAIADLGYVKEAAIIEPLELRNEKDGERWKFFCLDKHSVNFFRPNKIFQKLL
jgi:hypothetical protein